MNLIPIFKVEARVRTPFRMKKIIPAKTMMSAIIYPTTTATNSGNLYVYRGWPKRKVLR